MLNGKNVLLGITGGIAAYKTTFLVRLFIKAGANVKIILTDSASSFVSPLTLSTLAKNPVVLDFVKTEDNTVDWNNHVEMGLWADLMVIAPATANTMSKMTTGNCDNILMATYLSAKCPVFVAPAMDLDMYKHPSTKSSLEALASFGNFIIPATNGELASGLVGEGRMAEPEDIVEFIKKQLSVGLPLSGKKVLITAGPTYEAIDPVRFIGNHSSGLMGFELAKTAASLGAEVYLVTGPTHLSVTHDNIHVVHVVSADDMYHSAQTIAEQKIKKSEENFTIELVKNKDILKTFGDNKKQQFLVGFALETENEVENAKGKLKRKNLDAIVLNSMRDKGAGFGGATNKISFIDTNSNITTFELKTKAEVAVDIFNEIIKRRYA